MSDALSQKTWLSFSITPVQSFIESARTVRDLAVGSLLLDFLVGEALRAGQEAGGSPLYPTATKSGARPNQFLLSFDSEGKAEGAEAAIRCAVLCAWKKLAAGVKGKLAGGPWSGSWDSGWQEQIESFWDLRLLRLPLHQATKDVYQRLFPGRPGEDDPFRRAWSILAAALQASKQVRAFPPHTQDQGREHCSLFPDLEQMGPGGTHAEQRAFWERCWGFTRGGLRVGQPDRLSAVALVKRFAPLVALETDAGKRHLPGTSTRAGEALDSWREGTKDTAQVATAGWQAEVQQPPETVPRKLASELSHAWASFVEAAGKLNAALKSNAEPPWPGGEESLGRLLLEERLDAGWLRKEFLPRPAPEEDPPWLEPAAGALQDVASARSHLIRLARKAGLGSPPRYLAALAVDGDHMGKRLSGEYCGEGDAYGEGFLQKLSDALLSFADSARKAVADVGGLPIYFGGDDGLALLHLQEALPCARCVQKKLEAAGLPGTAEPATLSGTVVLFHYKHDLRDALRQTREAEQEAKAFGRNACALRVLKRSGGALRAVVEWHHLDLLTDLQGAFLQGASDRWIGMLRQLSGAVSESTEAPQMAALLGYFVGQRQEGDEALRGRMRNAALDLWQGTETFLDERHRRLTKKPGAPNLPKRGDQGFEEAVFRQFLELAGMATFLARGRE